MSNYKHYFLVIVGGTDPDLRGPFETEDERDKAAAACWTNEAQPPYDSIFRLTGDMPDAHGITSFLEGELEELGA